MAGFAFPRLFSQASSDIKEQPRGSGRERAIREAEMLIRQYKHAEVWNRQLHHIVKTLTIISGGITPLLMLFLSFMDSGVTSGRTEYFLAVPATAAAILAGISASFQWREKAAEYQRGLAVLENELLKLEALGEKYTLESFIKTVTHLRQCELVKPADASQDEKTALPKDEG